MQSAAGANEAGTAEELEQLADLRDRSVIEETDFRYAKVKVLS